jgi:GNAT superfamily N-acetyltransferase
MRPCIRSVRKIEEQFERITQIRRHGENFSTNLYAMPAEVQSWSDRGELKYLEYEDGLVLIRTDGDLSRLYHVAGDEEALEKLLTALGGEIHEIAIAELVGRGHDAQAAVDVYRRCRFRDYTTLLRMTRAMEEEAAHPENGPSRWYAETQDVGEVRRFLERVLDPLRDHIPRLAEIEEAIACEQVLVEKVRHEIRGLLLSENTSASSILRYWYVDPAHCHEGIGGRLMREYLRLCRGKKRISLWVVSDNQGAIEQYRHYGFQFDGLSDQIMVRKESIKWKQ